MKRPRQRLLWSALAISVLAPAARAELLRVEQSFGGIECASCVESVAKGLKRLRGVESVELDAEKSVVRIALAEGNRVKLEAIRDAIKATGYTPGDATLEARGKVSGKQFALTVTNQIFEIEGEALPAEGAATIHGAVPASAAGEPLRLRVRSARVAAP